jgi:outer membrane lipase/esterase
MKKLHPWWMAAAAGLVLAACGGGGDGDQSPRATYGKMVVFGDSLSDVGTYAVPSIQAFGGGKYTVNAPDAKIWVELLASQLGLPAPCAAQTGLNSVIPTLPGAAVTNNAGCYGYAQGGARVTNPVGPGNINLLALGDTSGALGQLTVPVKTQIANHLALSGGSFAADDLVTMLAGGNDLFINLATVSATAEATGGDPTAVAAASEAAVKAMATAATELAGYVKTELVAKGATRVVVVNVPDVSKTPLGLSLDASSNSLVLTMVTTFNSALAAGLKDATGVLVVDAFTVSQDQAANPAQYGLTNVTTPVCDLAGALASLPTSLICTSATLVAGADPATSEYADTVHPTPYGYRLLAQLVTDNMAKKGWL